MKKISKQVRVFVLAVLSGIAIAIGGCVYLSLENKLAGALMFTIGLYTICIHELNLYTGKVGYLVEQPPEYCLQLLIIWLGNLFGTWLAAMAMSETRIFSIAEQGRVLCQTKMNDSYTSLFLLAIFCGLLMFVSVDGYKKTEHPVILFMGVATFILCGFEHCIADMFYFSVAQCWSGDVFLRVLVITLGNSLGGILIPLAKKLPEK